MRHICLPTYKKNAITTKFLEKMKNKMKDKSDSFVPQMFKNLEGIQVKLITNPINKFTVVAGTCTSRSA